MYRQGKPKTSAGWVVGSLLASAALLAIHGVAQAGSIEDTIRAALDSNPEIGVVREDRRAVDQELRQARSLTLPQVDLRAAAGPEYRNTPATRGRATRPPGGDAGSTQMIYETQITLTQMLFDGFAAQSELERQTARVDSAAYRVQEAAEFIALNAVEAHLDVLRNEELVELARDNIGAHERILGQVRQLEELGRTGIADVRQGEARLANARVVLATAEGNLLDAIATYRNVVGEMAEALERPVPPLAALPEGPEAAATLASTGSPNVLIRASDVDVSRAEIAAARSGFYPRLDLELGAGAGENVDGLRGGSVDAQALVVMRYNLFRGGADIAREREAFARMNEARQVLTLARREAEQEARLSYNALTTARARAEGLRQQVEANRNTRDAYAQQFEIGQRTLLDLLDSENELFVARSSMITAEYTQEFAVYRVLAVAGLLLDALGIERPRETITIWRTPEDVHDAESIDSRTGSIRHPFEEPQPFRPALDPDGGGPGDGASLDGEPTTATAAAAPTVTPEYDSFSSFVRTVFRGEAAPSEAASAPTQTAAAPTRAPRSAARPAAGEEVSYDSFGSFVSALRGGGDTPAQQAESVAPPSEPTAPAPVAVYAEAQGLAVGGDVAGSVQPVGAADTPAAEAPPAAPTFGEVFQNMRRMFQGAQ